MLRAQLEAKEVRRGQTYTAQLIREYHIASRKGGGTDGDFGLSKALTSEDDDLERRMYGRGGGFFCSTGEVSGEMGEAPVISSNPSWRARGGGRSTMASRSYRQPN